MFILKKLLLSSYLLLSIVVFFNCNKRNDGKVKGFISFDFNGSILKIEPGNNFRYSMSDGRVRILITPILEKGIHLISLNSLDTVKLGGPFSSSNGDCEIWNSEGFGHFCTLYFLDTTDSKNNWVKINKEENDFRHIIGEFSATLYRNPFECSFGNPYGDIDTLRIRNGKFDICD
jgi:hypothetical protein